MTVTFVAAAKAEFREAVAYLNAQSEGLGFEFAVEVKRTLERICEFPEAWQPLSKRTRRCRTHRFPYGVVYQIRGEVILVIGVMHLHREPESWRNRLAQGEQ
jgi:plasmid stabilization system protein ParE